MKQSLQMASGGELSKDFLADAIRLLEMTDSSLLLMVGSITTASLIVLGFTLRPLTQDQAHNQESSQRHSWRLSKNQTIVWISATLLIIVGSIYPSNIVPYNNLTWSLAIVLFGLYIVVPVVIAIVTYNKFRRRKNVSKFLALQIHLLQSVALGGLIFLFRLSYSTVDVLFGFDSGLLAAAILAFSGILIVGFIQTSYMLFDLFK